MNQLTNKFHFFFKSQLVLILVLLLSTVIPYTLICLYVPQLPYMNYFFLLVIFILKALVFKDQGFEKKMRPQVQSFLSKKYKKNPSQTDIFNLIYFVTKARNITLLICGLGIVFISIIYGQF